MARNKYSRRLFPLKAHVVSTTKPFINVKHYDIPSINIGKLQLPAVGYVHIRFRDEIDNDNNRTLYVCVGSSLVTPDEYNKISDVYGKTAALRLSDNYNLDEGFHESIYDVISYKKVHQEYAHSSIFDDWYELKLQGVPESFSGIIIEPNSVKKIPNDGKPSIQRIVTKLTFNYKYKYFLRRYFEGNKFVYTLPISIKKQISYYVNKCLTNYIKRHCNQRKKESCCLTLKQKRIVSLSPCRLL